VIPTRAGSVISVSDHLTEQGAQIAVLRALAQDLARTTADLAGRIALTEDEIVRIHEDIAYSGVGISLDLLVGQGYSYGWNGVGAVTSGVAWI
jgi:hypothetical protein